MRNLSMFSEMTFNAKPLNAQRLIVIVMMAVHALDRAALLAWQLFDRSALYVNVKIRTGVHSLTCFTGESMGLTPISHGGVFMIPAVSMRRRLLALAAIDRAFVHVENCTLWNVI